MEKKTDIYKLDARVTILFSQAQVSALREVARKEQTSISGLVRKWTVSKLQDRYLDVLQNQIVLVKKEKQND